MLTTIEYLSQLVQEECNEIAQRASKLSRFGKDEIQEGQTLTNYQRLEEEYNDLDVVKCLLAYACGEVSPREITGIHPMIWKKKCDKINRYTALSYSRGVISAETMREVEEITEQFTW